MAAERFEDFLMAQLLELHANVVQRFPADAGADPPRLVWERAGGTAQLSASLPSESPPSFLASFASDVASDAQLAGASRRSSAARTLSFEGKDDGEPVQAVASAAPSQAHKKSALPIMSKVTSYASMRIPSVSYQPSPKASSQHRPELKPSKTALYTGDMPYSSRGALRSIIETTKTGTRACRQEAVQQFRCSTFVAEWFLAVLILSNSVSIGLSADLARDSPYWILVDSGFAAVFLLEMAAKMYRLGLPQYFLGSYGSFPELRDTDLRWRIFEFVLNILALLEIGFAAIGTNPTGGTSKASIFRILRLARVARIIRVCRLRMFSDLLMMINGAIGGMRTLFWSMILISLPLYAVALLLRESLGDEPGEGADNFSSLPSSFFTLFRCVVGSECVTIDGRPIFVLVTKGHGWQYGLLYILTWMLLYFGLFNVIAALYVENTMAAAKYTSLHQKKQRLLDQNMFALKIKELVEFIWRLHATREFRKSPDFHDGMLVRSSMTSSDICDVSQIEISLEFFQELRTFREFHSLLRDLDVSDEDQLDLFATLDVDANGTVDLEELIVGISKLRGDARRSDIVGVGLIVRSIQMALSRFEANVMPLLAYTAKRGIETV